MVRTKDVQYERMDYWSKKVVNIHVMNLCMFILSFSCSTFLLLKGTLKNWFCYKTFACSVSLLHNICLQCKFATKHLLAV